MRNFLLCIATMFLVAVFLNPVTIAQAQDPPLRPYVAWPDHNYDSMNPPEFEEDNVCGPGENPMDNFCWEPLLSGDEPIFDPQSDASPAGTDIASGTTDGTYPSLYYSFADLSEYPQEIQDQLPGGVVYIRMRLRGSPLSNNVNTEVPYASSAAWHFLFDVSGDGYTDFISRTYGVTDDIQIFFNDYDFRHVTPSTDELNTSCGPEGVRLWNEPTELVDFSQDTGVVDVPVPLGCDTGGGNNADKYCNFGYTRVVNKKVEDESEMSLLDMQFPLYAFRSCRSGDEYVPPGGGQAVRGEQAFEAGQPFMVCASTGTQANDLFAKDFAITEPSGYTPDVEDAVACSNPCTLEGGCDPGLLLIEASHECGTGPQGSPIDLNAVVMATNELLDDEVLTTVEEISFEYWQNSVSTDWQLIETLTAPSSGLNEYDVSWDTSTLDLSGGTEFQVRVTGLDKFDAALAETFVQIDLAEEECETTGVPVTLAYVSSSQSRNELEIEWSTSSEIANVGFNVRGETSSGRIVQLNRELIESAVVDSVEPQHYSFSTSRSDIRAFYLEDIDVRGLSRLHGPYEIDRSEGRRPGVQRIDWDRVHTENRSQQQARNRGWRQQNLDPVRILVDQDGVYRVTYSQLLDQGMDIAGIPVAHASLIHQDNPVPFHTEARGVFRPGDYIEFYGTGIDSLYTDDNVYQLHFDRRPGSRMQAEGQNASSGDDSRDNRGSEGRRPGSAVTQYHETASVWRERKYSYSSLSGSPWYDTRIMAQNGPATKSFDFDVEGLKPDQPASIHIQYWGMTSWSDVSPDQRVVVSLNGTELIDDSFDGRTLRSHLVDLPVGILNEGNNQLTVELPGDLGVPWNIIGFDGFEVSYPRELVLRDGSLHFEGDASRYRVSGLNDDSALIYRIEGDRVTRISNYSIEGDDPYSVTFRTQSGPARYFVSEPGQLLIAEVEPGRAQKDITSGQADYLMIAHPNFIDGLDPLVKFHQSQGRSVKVVDVFDIYDQYSSGVIDPKAIQSYIRATVEPMGYQHVLLVGGDTYDYKNTLNTNSISFIPSLYAATGEFVEFAPVDALFVDLDRNNVPDLPIGRLPVRTNAELDEVINKTLEYASRDYRQSAVFAADKMDPNMSFTDVSNRFVSKVAGDWTFERAYLDWMPVSDSRSVLKDAIAQGSSLTSFFGHSSYSIWTFDGLFSANDVPTVGNHGRPTAVVQYGCWNTYHIVPSYDTLGHSFMLTEQQGAAVVVGSSTWTAANSADRLGEKFMPRLISGEKTVGQALTQAKQDLAVTHPDLRDAILGWTILGDPAIVVSD